MAAPIAEVKLEEIYTAIRKIRDTRGDDRCWVDYQRLYELLPEGYTPPERDTTVELELCRQYIASCHDPKVHYVSPQRRIEELEDEVARLRERVAFWSGL